MNKPLDGRQPLALVYRSRCLSEGCPESLANLLATSPSQFSIIYVGPREETKLSKAVLANADLFAVGGGPGALHATCAFMAAYELTADGDRRGKSLQRARRGGQR